MALFDDFDWKQVASGLISSVPAIATNVLSNRAVQRGNTAAANVGADTSAQRIAVSRDSQARQEAIARDTAARQQAAVGAGNAAAVNQLEQIRRAGMAEAAPAISHFRATMARPASSLTPAQAIALEDAQRGLNNSGMLGRMGGRAFSRAHSDMTNRFRAGAVAENEGRRDRAAGQLAQGRNAANSAGAGIAQIHASGGRALADVAGNEGRSVSNAVAQGGRDVTQAMGGAADMRAGAIAANAQSQADTFGAIGSYFANSVKDAERDARASRYNREVWGG